MYGLCCLCYELEIVVYLKLSIMRIANVYGKILS